MIAIIVFADFSLHYVIVDLSLSPGFHCNLLTVIFWLLELSIFSQLIIFLPLVAKLLIDHHFEETAETDVL